MELCRLVPHYKARFWRDVQRFIILSSEWSPCVVSATVCFNRSSCDPSSTYSVAERHLGLDGVYFIPLRNTTERQLGRLAEKSGGDLFALEF